MKIVLISDTHGYHKQLGDLSGDVLIHAGDATPYGTEDQTNQFAQWWNKQEFEHKVFIPGNHDWLFQRKPDQAHRLFRNTHILIKGLADVAGLKIFGSSFQPYFHGWAFNVHGPEIKQYWDQIPDTVDIVVTHCPAFGVHDVVDIASPRVGCPYLAERLKDVNFRLHVCGHIHESRGASGGVVTDSGQSPMRINAACQDMYHPRLRGPFVVTVTDGLYMVEDTNLRHELRDE